MQKIIVPGKPCGKGRPRFARTGHAYTPETTRAAEAAVKLAARHIRPIDGGVRICVTAYFVVPRGVSKAVRERMLAGEIRPTVKPDADNILKLAQDALNGIAYADDKQVVSVAAEKFYAEVARVEIELEEAKQIET